MGSPVLFFQNDQAKFLVNSGLIMNDGTGLTYGTGSPEGVVSMPLGSIFIDKSTGTQYQKRTGTANTGWTAVATDASLGSLLYTIYVSKNGDNTSGNGSINKPYLTIQKALDQVPVGVDGPTVRRSYVIHVTSGTYDESLSIDIARKTVILYTEGSVNLGTFDASNWQPSGTARNITVTCSLVSLTSVRPSFSIISTNAIDSYGTHQAYGKSFRISGSFIASNSTGGTSGELAFKGVIFFGWDGVASGNSDSITAGGWAGNLNCYMSACRTYGAITGGVLRLQQAQNCSFDKLITIATYSQITESEIKAGMTWTVAPSEVPPIGIVNTVITGTFTGALNSNLIVDAITANYFYVNACSVANSAVLQLLDDARGTKFTNTTDLTSTDANSAINEVNTKVNNMPVAMVFKGAIALASDFPTSALVKNGWFYTITADVVDNDPTKTNTGTSFKSGDEIAWLTATSAWVVVGNTPYALDQSAKTNTITNADSAISESATYLFATGTSNRVATLDSASGFWSASLSIGKIITIKLISGTGTVTIIPNGTETIDGSNTSLVLSLINDAFRLQAISASEWIIL